MAANKEREAKKDANMKGAKPKKVRVKVEIEIEIEVEVGVEALC